MTETEQKAVLTLCLMAAFADGQDERERAQIKRIADSLAPGSALDLAALYQDVLLKRRTLEQVAAELTTPEVGQLAYEMAVCVCDADGAASAAESAFLERLRAALQLDVEAGGGVRRAGRGGGERAAACTAGSSHRPSLRCCRPSGSIPPSSTR